jgi:hypothetical protein
MIEAQNSLLPVASGPVPDDVPRGDITFGEMLAQTMDPQAAADTASAVMAGGDGKPVGAGTDSGTEHSRRGDAEALAGFAVVPRPFAINRPVDGKVATDPSSGEGANAPQTATAGSPAPAASGGEHNVTTPVVGDTPTAESAGAETAGAATSAGQGTSAITTGPVVIGAPPAGSPTNGTVPVPPTAVPSPSADAAQSAAIPGDQTQPDSVGKVAQAPNGAPPNGDDPTVAGSAVPGSAVPADVAPSDAASSVPVPGPQTEPGFAAAAAAPPGPATAQPGPVDELPRSQPVNSEDPKPTRQLDPGVLERGTVEPAARRTLPEDPSPQRMPQEPQPAQAHHTAVTPAATVEMPVEQPVAMASAEVVGAEIDPIPVRETKVRLDSASSRVDSTLTSPSARPASAPATSVSSFSATTSTGHQTALAERVLQAVELQANQPPPRTMVVDLPEIDGLRLVVSVRAGGEVHVVPASNSTSVHGLQPFLSELESVLADRGFVMTGDGRRRGGNPYNEEEQQLPRRPRPTYTRRLDDDLRI